MMRRNLFLLVTSSLISATGSIVMVTLGGIIGTTLSSNPALATLPVSLIVVSVAASAVPASLLMQRIGRRKGFMLASMTAAAATLLAYQAMKTGSFGLFCIAMAVFGINMAFTQQYRYAAVESVDSRYTARAISFVLFGAIGGALVGPELVTRLGGLGEVAYGMTMFALMGLYLLQSSLLGLLKLPAHHSSESAADEGRSVREIVRQPLFVMAVVGGTVGYGLMSLIMTATPLSMHVADGHSMQETASVIRAHVLAMYLPSLVSGFLIERIGVKSLMVAGIAALAGTCVVGLQGQAVLHYWWALVLLGVGWNFMYVGGTTLLTRTYRPEERFRAQAVNEFCVFGASATTSLLAGVVIHQLGWTTLVLIPLPILLATLVLVMSVKWPGRRSAPA